MVRFDPPTKYPGVPVKVMPVPAEMVEVATDWYAEEPPYKSWPMGAVVEPVPPCAMPSVPARVASERQVPFTA